MPTFVEEFLESKQNLMIDAFVFLFCDLESRWRKYLICKKSEPHTHTHTLTQARTHAGTPACTHAHTHTPTHTLTHIQTHTRHHHHSPTHHLHLMITLILDQAEQWTFSQMIRRFLPFPFLDNYKNPRTKFIQFWGKKKIFTRSRGKYMI